MGGERYIFPTYQTFLREQYIEHYIKKIIHKSSYTAIQFDSTSIVYYYKHIFLGRGI